VLADIDEAVNQVDETLVELSSKMRLFYHVAPLNAAREASRFLDRRQSKRQPRFEYGPLEFSAPDARRHLEHAPFDEIGDDVLRDLYEDKRWELDQTVSMLEARGNSDFLDRSLDLFGRPPAAMVEEAEDLLTRTSWEEDKNLEAEEVRELLEEHVETYRRRYRDFDCEVVVDGAMSAKMYVHENRIHLKEGSRFSREAALSDAVHEIDAHVLTFLNGRRQRCRLFEIGPRGTLAYQESLGVFTEIANGLMFPGRMIALAARVVAVAAMVDGAEFSEVFEGLTTGHGLDEDEAFLICLRVFRGGGFTKDWLYVSQLERILRHWASGGNMEHLLLGKITMDILDGVEDLSARGILRRAGYLPQYLDRIARGRDNEPVQRALQRERIPLRDLLSLNLH
jgi:uncharacterized protein (TIGR02421 family)